MRPRKSAIAMLWMAAATVCSGSQDKLTVLLIDSAGTPREVLLSAAEKARQALRTAGLESEWIPCSDCVLPPAGTYALMKIVPARWGAAQGAEDLGRANRCPAAQRCTTSWAFYGPIQEFAEKVALPVDLVLGYIMVHEIGHLMGLGHDWSGFMKAGLEKSDLLDAAAGRSGFPAYDAKKIRATAAIWKAPLAAAVASEGR